MCICAWNTDNTGQLYISLFLPSSSSSPSLTPQVVVRCGWLRPPHEASLPVDVHEPLTLSYSEHSAGERSADSAQSFTSHCAVCDTLPSSPSLSTFLQLTLENSYPAPLCLRSPSLSADVSMTQLHNSFPEVNNSIWEEFISIKCPLLCRCCPLQVPSPAFGRLRQVPPLPLCVMG